VRTRQCAKCDHLTLLPIQTFAFSVKPDTDGVYSISLPEGIVADPAGNRNAATGLTSITYGMRPSVVTCAGMEGK